VVEGWGARVEREVVVVEEEDIVTRLASTAEERVEVDEGTVTLMRVKTMMLTMTGMRVPKVTVMMRHICIRSSKKKKHMYVCTYICMYIYIYLYIYIYIFHIHDEAHVHSEL
jgi:hypothetical protein